MTTALLEQAAHQLEDKAELQQIDRSLTRLRGFLTAKQINFCEELAMGTPKKLAMERAGYSGGSAKAASSLLEANQGLVNDFYQLLLKRHSLTNAVSKRWIASKLIHVVETAQEREEHKVVIAACAELNKMYGHHAPINVKVDNRVSVSYEFVGMDTPMPQIKESVIEGEIIKPRELSEAALEFQRVPLPRGY